MSGTNKSLTETKLLAHQDYKQVKKNFYQELVNASHDKKTSLFFLKHYLPEKPLVTQGIIQGIVIGGTNYIVATVNIASDGSRHVLSSQTGRLPTLNDDQTLYDFLEEHMDERASSIGLNFGFPLTPAIGEYGELDGIIMTGTKEHAFTGLIGTALGKKTRELFQKKYGRTIRVSVANDTICLTLAGNKPVDGALVAGTGFNISLIIKENEKRVLVNLEAGNFDKFEPSETLKRIDALSDHPGTFLLQKTVSGKYLALYFNERLKELDLNIPPIVTSQELSELSHENHADITGDLARSILERSAFLVATSLAGIYEFSGRPKSMRFIGEGSMLWDGWHYPQNIEKQLEMLGVPKDAIVIEHIKDSSINGAIGLLTS